MRLFSSSRSQVFPVDAGMLARTRQWLLRRSDGAGGFLRNDRSLDSFGAAPATIVRVP